MNYADRMKKAQEALDEFVAKWKELSIPVLEITTECVGDMVWETPSGNVLVRGKRGV